MTKIAINTKTTGNFEKRFLNDREHIVTDMVPIVGNSVMNKGFYPLLEVQNTFDQLHFLPAPNGHPKVGNKLVSAFHPLAVNAFNIGGLVRNPRMDGDKVINEFWLDIEVANQTDDGKELIRRIENGEKVGVSTGLNVTQDITNGEFDGESYDWIATNMHFDHVAILLNEKAAGDHVGTELQTNEDNTMVVNCTILNELKSKEDSIVRKIKELIGGFQDNAGEIITSNAVEADDLRSQLAMRAKELWPQELWWVWTHAIFPTEKEVIFEVEKREDNTTVLIRCTYSIDSNDQISLNDDKTIVVKKVEFVAVDGDVNNNNESEEDDMSKENENQDVTNGDTLNVENAVKLLEAKGFKVNSKEESDQLQYLIDNKERFAAIINKEEAELVTLRADLVANSDMTEDDVKDMGKDMLIRLSNSVTPPQDYSVGSGKIRQINSVNEDDFESSYLPKYDDAKGGN